MSGQQAVGPARAQVVYSSQPLWAALLSLVFLGGTLCQNQNFEAAWRYSDDASSTRVEGRPREFAPCKNEPRRGRDDISGRSDSVVDLHTGETVGVQGACGGALFVAACFLAATAPEPDPNCGVENCEV